jgi:hypothetical protein
MSGLTWEDTGLRPREQGVLRDCIHARRLVENGHYLTSGRQQTAAAHRLVEKGMLTKAEAQPAPTLPDSIVVFLTPENWQAVQDAAEANRAKRLERGE